MKKTIASALIAATSMITSTGPSVAADQTQAITNAVQGFFMSVDAREWDDALEHMDTPYWLDYESFGGAPGADTNPVEVVQSWRTIMDGFDFIQHHLSPLIIEQTSDNTAEVRMYVEATHHIADAAGGANWTVFGSYEFELNNDEGPWVIDHHKFNFTYTTGNGNLPVIAGERVAASK